MFKKMYENMKSNINEYIKALNPMKDFSESIDKLTRGALNMPKEDDKCKEEQTEENEEKKE